MAWMPVEKEEQCYSWIFIASHICSRLAFHLFFFAVQHGQEVLTKEGDCAVLSGSRFNLYRAYGWTFFLIFKDSHFLKVVNVFNQRKCSLSLPPPMLLFKNYVPAIMNVRESVAKEAWCVTCSKFVPPPLYEHFTKSSNILWSSKILICVCNVLKQRWQQKLLLRRGQKPKSAKSGSYYPETTKNEW